MTTTTATALAPERLVDAALHADGTAHAVWQRMRETSPVHYHQAGEYPAFWSLTKYDDIRAVYRDPSAFSSERGVLLRPAQAGDDPGGGLTLALSDPPRHKDLRSIVADWFSTRAVRGLSGHISAAVRTTLGWAAKQEECDFAHQIAGRISLSVICRILGIPEQDHDAVLAWTDEAFAAHTSLAAHQDLMDYLTELMYRRMLEPTGDLMSALVGSTVEGDLLSEEEVLLNCENIIGATENGRLALIGGMFAFLRDPGQWERLRLDRDLMPSAIEEILRWTSTATHSMRTATRPQTIRGRRVEAGDRVVLWLPSANRDEDVFSDPHAFDIARNPNRHIALASGEHFCIGSTLARAEMRILFSTLLDTTERIELTGPPVQVRSIAVNGLDRLPVRITRH